MPNKYQFHLWFLMAGIYTITLWFGVVENNPDAMYACVGFTWVSIGGTCLLLIKHVRNRVRVAHRPVPWWIDSLLEWVAATILILNGYPLVGGLFILHTACYTYIYLKPLEK